MLGMKLLSVEYTKSTANALEYFLVGRERKGAIRARGTWTSWRPPSGLVGWLSSYQTLPQSTGKPKSLNIYMYYIIYTNTWWENKIDISHMKYQKYMNKYKIFIHTLMVILYMEIYICVKYLLENKKDFNNLDLHCDWKYILLTKCLHAV